jgi:hypothetical protein
VPAQEEQVFRVMVVIPVTLSVLTLRERGGGLVAGRVRGVLVLLLLFGREDGIIGKLKTWAGSEGLRICSGSMVE